MEAQLAQGPERRTPAQRLQPVRLVTLEADHRHLAGRAMDAHVGDIALPPGKVRLERLPGRKGMPGDGVLLQNRRPGD
jgi:hypothetical protein